MIVFYFKNLIKTVFYYHASCEPPGIIDGPYLAPSSPPETPLPTKCIFFSANKLHLRWVSLYSELPPSIMISPGSKRPTFLIVFAEWIYFWVKYLFLFTNWFMKSSTALPACTISITRLGFFNESIISWMECAPTIFVPFASFSRNLSTFSTVLLNAHTFDLYQLLESNYLKIINCLLRQNHDHSY